MILRIVLTDAFHASVAGLDDTPEIAEVIKALMLRAAKYPENAAMLPGTKIRAIRSRTYGAYPALRLFYTVDDAETVRLLHVESYDELL